MKDNETLAVAFVYVALALISPVLLTRLAQWAESDDADNLAREISAVIEATREP